MPRWLLWTPVMALTVATALIGVRAGLHVATLSESDVINKAAQDYVNSGQGRHAHDCYAVPSPEYRFWLTVRCRSQDGVSEIYHASRDGRLRLGVVPALRPET